MLRRDTGTVRTTRQHILQAQLVDVQPMCAETIPLILTSHNFVFQFLSLSCWSVHWRWFKCCVLILYKLISADIEVHSTRVIFLKWTVALILCWFLISSHADHMLKNRLLYRWMLTYIVVS